MKRFLLAPDSYKGTLDAEELCSIWSQAIWSRIPDAIIECLPMADGGEGMVDRFLHAMGGGRRINAVATGPEGLPVEAFYGLCGDWALIEMAACAGLPLVMGDKDPLRATTYGVGELILQAEAQGARKLLIGLGGSATNDGGIGMAAALGYRFLDEAMNPLEPAAYNLIHIRHIERPRNPVQLTAAAARDVDNPLCGPTGATAVFGPQKGVSAETAALLEDGLLNLSKVMYADLGIDVRHMPGAGAAGGLGAGAVAFLGASLKPGIDMLLDAAHFDEKLANCDLVFTGEGRIDGQSVHGKVPVGVARRARKAGIPCVALCGSIGSDAQAVYQEGITALFSATRGACTFEEIKTTCRDDAKSLMDSVLRLILSICREG